MTREEVHWVRYRVDGEADSRWNFRRNGPLLSNKAQADTRLFPELVADLRVQQLMVAPITRGPQILGLLAVADRMGRAPFTDEDLNLLLALAGQATIAVENLRLHEEIKRANELLQEYDRLKSEPVGIVAHDFRKPLMAIRGSAELVLEEMDLPLETRQDFMRTVISETEHLALLAFDTLLITQIDGPDELQLPRDRLRPPSSSTRCRSAFPDHSVLMDVPPAFPKIWRIPTGCGQVLTNLVSNAVKYCPRAARSSCASASAGRSTS
ncbi:MAG: GAF domain-containing protein [Vicinamibacteria bacterium]